MRNPNAELQEARLVLRAQLGDRAALDELLRLIQERLLRFLVHRLDSETDAEDCMQVVLIQMCRKLAGLREPRALRPWMFRIAAREAQRLKRKRGLPEDREGLLEEVPVAEPLDAFQVAEQSAELQLAIAALPKHSREIIFLHYLEGLTLNEISHVLKKPLGTIKSRLAYGLANLRKQIKEID